MATSLLDFILQLLGSADARGEFQANPQAVLRENGFDSLCGADVRDARPLIVDSVQTAQHNSFDRNLSGGGPQVHHTPPPPATGDDDMDDAIREIHNITNHYSWSDSHNTVLDNSVNQNIWADGDVEQTFDNDPVVASGDGAVAAGDDIRGTVTTGDGNAVGEDNEVTNVGSASGEAVSIGDGGIRDSANDTHVEAYGSGNVAVASNGSSTGQNDSHDWESNDSHDDNSVNNSFNDTDNSTDIDDSYNTDNSTDDSYNTDTDTTTVTETDNSVDIDDSYNSASASQTTTVHDVDVDDSFNETDVDVDVEDNVIVG